VRSVIAPPHPAQKQTVLDRRTERAERRRSHIAESRKRAAEADAKLRRLYDAIENGVADLSDPMLKDRIGELKATRDQARLDAERMRSNTLARPSRHKL
jgi:site-specific DNA recombinase